MRRYRTIIRLLAALPAVAFGRGCGDGDGSTAPPPPEPAFPTTITVTPAKGRLTALDATIGVAAEVRDQNASVMAGVTVAWTSSATGVVVVDAPGLVTAAGQGVATIMATAGSASGSAAVTVTQTVSSVVVGPPRATITALGDTLRLEALAFDANGYSVASAEFSWASSDAAIATVDTSGLVTAVAEGTATITASAGEASGFAEITITEISGTGTDRDILVALYEATDGPNWKNAENWLTDVPLGDWHGVDTDAQVRVTRLQLGFNDLTGSIPRELGNLTSLTELSLRFNGLTGPIPRELGNLTSLTRLQLSQSTSNGLTGPIPTEFGNLTRLAGLELEGNALTGPVPSELGNLARLTELVLSGNALTGPIPTELGNLTSLTGLELDGNALTGPVPPELGNLARLTKLRLEGNALTGPVPPELGNLARLRELRLEGNDFTGPIPSELGNLARLTELRLEGNSLTGPIPSELGNLARLTKLPLEGNALTGPVPSELGNLARLTLLNLSGNSGMAGILPTELTGLDRLETLLTAGTDLCAPSDSSFRAWLGAIYRVRVATCASDRTSIAYLTQAVQSRKYPVPLVAGEKALLRVFVIAASSTTASIPPVRARFYVDSTEVHVADIPARTAAIPTEVDEGDLSRSSNAEIPGETVRPGLEMVVEIDPEGTLDPGLGVAKRIPETGRIAVDVREMPALHLTVVPFLWSTNPHWAVVEIAKAMEADPEGHELLWQTRTLLPIGDLEVTAHAPVLTSSSHHDFYSLFDQTKAIQAIEGGSGHYMGTMSNPGRVGVAGAAEHPGRVFISRLNPTTLVHELGHTMSLYHAPACRAGGPDPAFPYPDGSIGAWGYDFRYGGALASPGRPDLMSYCERSWISDYHFANALRFRLFDEGPAQGASLTAQGDESLLLWGGMSAEGEPFLNPSFVVDARPLLPNAAGEHRIAGRSDTGNELFSLNFDLPEVADGDGSSSFAFVLPVEPGWADSLASITLSGPAGSVTLDSDTDLPMSILLDASTGQVRGILRDLPPATQVASDAVGGTSEAGLKMLFSRGIPDAGAWGRP